MVIAIRFRGYTEVETKCQVVAIVYNGNGDNSIWFCNVRAFFMVKSSIH